MTLFQAVTNFFKEQGRIRGTFVQRPGHGDSWTPLKVCGQVYKASINQLISDVTGMAPNDKQWLSEYQKARSAVWYSLSDDERQQVELLYEKWTRTGLPKPVKKKYRFRLSLRAPYSVSRRNYDRSCKRELGTLAINNLKNYGVYTFFVVVGEPGLGVKTELLVCTIHVLANVSNVSKSGFQ